jgi:type I restriction enzyme R subunit
VLINLHLFASIVNNSGECELARLKETKKLCISREIGAVAVELLKTLKAEKLRIDHWTDKEATRDAVRLVIRDFLWSESTGLPVDQYTEPDVHSRADEVYRHVFRAYPTLPSPHYGAQMVV